MIGRAEFLTDCVVTIVSDDYESFETILEQTRKLAAVHGIEIGESEVAAAVRRATVAGLIQTYILSTREPFSTKVPYSESDLPDLWFYVTPDGKKTVKSMAELGSEDL